MSGTSGAGCEGMSIRDIPLRCPGTERAKCDQSNSYSRHYVAVFALWNRFLRSDLTLSCHALANADQGGAFLAAGLGYRDINDFGLTFTVSGTVGPEDAEYVLGGDAVRLQILAEAVF